MELINQNLTSAFILLINFVTTVSYFIIYSKDNLKKSFFILPVILQKLYVAFFVFPLFTAPFFSNTKFANPNSIIITSGVIIVLTGLLIIAFSFLMTMGVIGHMSISVSKKGLFQTPTYLDMTSILISMKIRLLLLEKNKISEAAIIAQRWKSRI